MKINWFSPLPPARTDIAHYTQRVLPALSARADVTLWTDINEWSKDLERYAEVRLYHPDTMDWAAVNRADCTFYHIGNNRLFHGAIWETCLKHSGIVVLHDVRLHHFFYGIYKAVRHDRAGYLAAMEFYYGKEGLRDGAECYDSDASNINYMAERYPLTEFALSNALGVLVHNKEAFHKLSEPGSWPVAYAPLPFNLDGGTDGYAERGSLPPFRLVIFGYLSRNRRLDQVLEALASLPHRDQFHLEIYGDIWDQRYVRGRINTLRLKNHVSLRGFVTEEELDGALSSAHLAINLRYPTMGEASGSQLRCWRHGLPTLVTRTGWYAALPEDTVAFVSPENEIEDIQRNLNEFLASPSRFRAMGENGRRILREEHSTESYAAAIVDLVKRSEVYRRRAVATRLAEEAGRQLGTMGPASASDDMQTSVARNVLGLIS
jgi:glycosyltransferase involved in cell wall biosynthesis